jgi:hypothetical protein
MYEILRVDNGGSDALFQAAECHIREDHMNFVLTVLKTSNLTSSIKLQACYLTS